MGTSKDFSMKVKSELASIGKERLAFNQKEEWLYGQLYRHIEEYATANELLRTCVALPVIRSLFDGTYRGWITDENGEHIAVPYIYHCLSVCRMLIDLHIPLNLGEEDKLLATALYHDVIGHILGHERKEELLTVYKLDRDIYETLLILNGRDYSEGECHKTELEQMWETGNKFALLVRLVDCSSIIEQLYSAPMRVAKEYIYQTRMNYMPMCIRMKERYPELFNVAGIIMEKMKSLSDVTEILVSRYESRETELNQELLALRDENVRMRRKINMLRK